MSPRPPPNPGKKIFRKIMNDRTFLVGKKYCCLLVNTKVWRVRTVSRVTREQNKQISIDFLTKPNLNLVSKHPESFNNFSCSLGNYDSSDFIFLNNIFRFIDKMSGKFFISFSTRFTRMFKVSSYQPRGCIISIYFLFITKYGFFIKCGCQFTNLKLSQQTLQTVWV